MKKLIKGLICAGLILVTAVIPSIQTRAQEEENRILTGVYVEEMSLEGKTKSEAKSLVETYVESLSEKMITLIAVGGNEVQVKVSDLGLYWSNQEIIDEAVNIGQTGNVVQRYKTAKDLQYQNKVYRLEFGIDQELVKTIIREQCAAYDMEAADATLTRENDRFVIIPGQTGEIVDEAASVKAIQEYLNSSWNREDDSIELTVTVKEARGSEEELEKVKDVLGTFTTSFKTSGSSRSANVRNGAELINGTTLYPGDEFSTYEAVSPFSQANGYYMAGSYLNGQVVDSLGGGICQVSTTLYNAVLLSELEVTERHNHSMIVTYVDPSADAAIAESSGKDFKFVNNTEAPIYIEGTTTDDKQISFTIYGVETRQSNRQVSYESEVISKTYPDSEVIYTDASLPVGSISVQSAHIGYRANLWKVVTENGVEVSREQINSSSYQVTPRTATVGIATADPNAYNEIMAAIATNNIDHVKNVVAALAAAAAPPAAEAPAAPPAEGAAPPAEAAPEQAPAQ
ncbi:MAG: VanW family protein [Lachnospiraceae bacterium]|nr:VanW family protein [Lachnospiraceae bacterium]